MHLANDLQLLLSPTSLSVLDWECSLVAMVKLADEIEQNIVMPCG